MEGVSINGPKIIFEIPILGGIKIPETLVNSWIIMVVLIVLAFVLTRKMERVPGKRQLLAESYVNFIRAMVTETMGKEKLSYAPYIGTLFIFSIVSNFSSLIGLRAPTSDFNTTLGWALITTFLIHKAKMKNGLGSYLKGYVDPLPFMLPLNIVSEIATPISMSFRHYGNLIAGYVITTLLYGALGFLTTALFNITIPILQLGIPAVLSVYFDIFTGFIQAFIFSTLSMVFITMALDD
ncbi:MAG: F0F1 ATP synthase subunit A [Oscillospiraceae bacterium]